MTQPYYSDDHVSLFVGDWRELIAPDFRADLILTDPPYGETSLAWDRWPVGWPELAARHSDAMWCFGSMRMFLDRRDEFADWKLSQDVVWEKHNGSGAASDRFRRVHEHALHWYRGDWSAVQHETPRVAAEHGFKGHVIRMKQPVHWGETGSATWEDDGSRLQRSVIEAPSMWRQAINETEKPTAVLEPLLTYGCPPGGTVLDLFAGSCSTGVAAKRAGRRAVLYELREEQAELAARRLAQDVLDFDGGAA
jgi:site-specific DNA-methyltransferase (adenine-specific)